MHAWLWTRKHLNQTTVVTIKMGESLGDRLKRFRLENGFTIKEVAEKIHVPVTTYREWEHNRKIVGEPYVELARIFEVSVYELITGEKTSSVDVSNSFETIERELRKLKENLLSK